MEEFIKILHTAETKLGLNTAQTSFLYGTLQEITLGINSEDLNSLHVKGYLKNNKPTDICLEILKDLENYSTKTIKVEKDIIVDLTTKGIIMEYAKTFFYDYKYLKHLNNNYIKNDLLSKCFLIFLNMFPKDKEHNEKWEKIFKGTNASGVNLRRATKGTANKFVKLSKRYDMGHIFLATFIFIMGSRRQQNSTNIYYVKSLEKYFDEFEQFHYEALKRIKSREEVSINKNTYSKENLTTVFL